VTVKCVACKHWRLKGSALAQNGFGLCTRQAETATFYAAHFERECKLFTPAGTDITFGRHAWLRRVDELLQASMRNLKP